MDNPASQFLQTLTARADAALAESGAAVGLGSAPRRRNAFRGPRAQRAPKALPLFDYFISIKFS